MDIQATCYLLTKNIVDVVLCNQKGNI